MELNLDLVDVTLRDDNVDFCGISIETTIIIIQNYIPT